ncbi:MAG: hypothetical protein DRO12_01240 [Thermoprotei archaeon]|nr:MAG: hypothetical protein DRO12_01240 [Thermoprotei archaeon]
MVNSKSIWTAIALLALFLVGVGAFIAKLAADYSKLSEDVSKSYKEIGEIREMMGDVSSAVDELNTIVKNELGRVVEKLDELTAAYSEHSQAISGIRTELINLTSELRTRVEELRREVESLKQESAKNEDLELLAGKLKEVEDRVKRIEEKLSKAASLEELKAVRRSLDEVKRSLVEVEKLLEFPATIVDAARSLVVIPSRPSRIVSLAPSATEILFAINASTQLVGVDTFSNYPPDVEEMKINGSLIDIGSGWYPNVEKIIGLNPDLVVGVESIVSHRTVKEILSRYGIPMLLLPDRTLEDVYKSIIIVGRATGHLKEALNVVNNLRSEITLLRSLVSNVSTRPRTALIVWLSPLWVTGNETWMHDLLVLAQGQNVFSNISGWSMVGPEALLEAQPEVVIFTAGDTGITNCSTVISTFRDVLGEAVNKIPAVANNRVYCVYEEYNDILVRPSPRVAKALKLLIALIHPEVLGLKPDEIPNDVKPETFELPKYEDLGVEQSIRLRHLAVITVKVHH